MGDLVPQRLIISIPLCVLPHPYAPCTTTCARGTWAQPLKVPKVPIHSVLLAVLADSPGFQPPAGPGVRTVNINSHQRALRFSPLLALGWGKDF